MTEYAISKFTLRFKNLHFTFLQVTFLILVLTACGSSTDESNVVNDPPLVETPDPEPVVSVTNLGFGTRLNDSAQDALFSLSQYVTPMGFHLSSVVPTTDRHWQGITQHSAQSEYFYVAKGGAFDEQAGLFAVQIDKSDPTSSFVGNTLLSSGKDAFEVDPGMSQIINEQIQGQGQNPSCYHYGGLQASGSETGSIVVVGLEDCYDANGGIADRIAVWDTSDPANPIFAGDMRVNNEGSDKVYSTGVIHLTGNFSNTAAAYFLVYVNGALDGSYNRASLYVVQIVNGKARFFEEEGVLFSIDPSALTGWDKPQNSSLITDSEGKLYVVNTNRVEDKTDDMARLYEIKDLAIDQETLKVSNFSLEYVNQQVFFSYNSASGSSDFGDFWKGAGLVVGAHGGLNIYSIENSNDGIYGSVLVGEFVGRTANSQAECDTLDGAYAIFYRDKNFSGKNITMSYWDVLSADNDFHNLAVYSGSINNHISSAKWCLPADCQLAVYRSVDSGDGQAIFEMSMTGEHYYEDADLSDNLFSDGSSLEDQITRINFLNMEHCGPSN